MPTDVEKLTGLEHGEFMDIMSEYLYESIGAAEFGRRHPLIEKSCVVVPSTAHISFTKAVTIFWDWERIALFQWQLTNTPEWTQKVS